MAADQRKQIRDRVELLSHRAIDKLEPLGHAAKEQADPTIEVVGIRSFRRRLAHTCIRTFRNRYRF